MMFAIQNDFDHGAAFDTDQARERRKWERLHEVARMKGDGEAHPLLPPEDESAAFETWDAGDLDMTQEKTPEVLPGDYAREGLERGLKPEAEPGVNPFRFDKLGASDSHIAMTGPPATPCASG